MAVQLLSYTNYKILRNKYQIYIIKVFWLKKISGFEMIKLLKNIIVSGGGLSGWRINPAK